MKTAAAARIHHCDDKLAIKGEHFIQMLQAIELLHRRFLDVITTELGRRETALSSVQALILSHVGDKPISLGQLQSLGHYEGTNLTYNIGKLAKNGYVILSRPQWDKRSSLIELTSEGREVAQLISKIIDGHAGALAEIGISGAELSLITRTLTHLNKFWTA